MGRGIIRSVTGLIICIFAITSCVVPPEKKEGLAPSLIKPAYSLKKLNTWAMPEFSEDLSYESLMVAVRNSFEYYGRLDPNKKLKFGKSSFTAKEMQTFLQEFVNVMEASPPGNERRTALQENFDVYQGGGSKRDVLFTGYYTPVLYGSRLPGIDYMVPIYGRPRDMITVNLGSFNKKLEGMQIVGRYQDGGLVPYYSRHEIDRQGMLSGRGCEIVWVKDPINAFFLQIQGSGKVLLPDRSTMNVHYAGTNGRPYRSIGKYLIETGKIPAEEMSMQTLKRYLKANPEEMDKILDHNESYVFFAGADVGMPLGSLGVKVTPGRSIAVDHKFYTPGALAYIETEVPIVGEDERLKGWRPIRRFVLIQDKGGAIKGPNRADLFWGDGEDASKQAGWMNRPGRLYLLAPKKKGKAVIEYSGPYEP